MDKNSLLSKQHLLYQQEIGLEDVKEILETLHLKPGSVLLAT